MILLKQILPLIIIVVSLVVIIFILARKAEAARKVASSESKARQRRESEKDLSPEADHAKPTPVWLKKIKLVFLKLVNWLRPLYRKIYRRLELAIGTAKVKDMETPSRRRTTIDRISEEFGRKRRRVPKDGARDVHPGRKPEPVLKENAEPEEEIFQPAKAKPASKPEPSEDLSELGEEEKPAVPARRPEAPDNARSLITQSDLLIAADKTEEAEKKLIRAISLEPQNSEAYRKLGTLYLQKKNFEDAASAFDQVIKLGSMDEADFRSLGTALYRQGKFESALKIFEEVYKMDPEETKNLVNLGIIYHALQKYWQAVKYFKKALLAKEDDLKILRLLAKSAANLPDKLLAKTTYHKIIELAPDDEQAKADLDKIKEADKIESA